MNNSPYDHIKDDPQYPPEKYKHRTAVKCYNCSQDFWIGFGTQFYKYYCTDCRLKGEHHRTIRIYHRIKEFLR